VTLNGGDTPRLALPNKGRLAEPALQLLRDSGLEVEVSPASLTTSARNYDLDLLFVRAEDVPEYVADGLVDAGITGVDLVSERSPGLEVVLELGFGACTLTLAVPRASGVQQPEELGGQRVATSFPRLTNAYFESRGVAVQLVDVRGAVEVTPQLGVADAVVDLVATGSTLRLNGLRPVASLLDSQAVLVTRPNRSDDRWLPLVGMLRSVIDARGKEYMMMNAPAAALDRIRELIPGLSGPTVMPLADPSMIAVHAVAERATMWRLIPALKDAGARDILIVPIEKMVR
jgi:ATP phosphoribosyltransferase